MVGLREGGDRSCCYCFNDNNNNNDDNDNNDNNDPWRPLMNNKQFTQWYHIYFDH